MTELDAENITRIEENRDDLQALADSDLPIAWAAETLLAAADDHDETGHAGARGDR